MDPDLKIADQLEGWLLELYRHWLTFTKENMQPERI